MLAWRLLWREWNSGELRIMCFGLILAVSIVTSIGLFVDRLAGAMSLQGQSLMGGDRILTSPRPVPQLWLQEADRLGIQRAETLTFVSMIYQGADMQLASIKAVDAHYPLVGMLETRRNAEGPIDKSPQGPAAGEVWLESRLFPVLQIRPGEQVYIGDLPLRASRILQREPDRAVSAFSMGPRVLMNLADIPATNVVQPGSRVRYNYLFSGNEQQLESYSRWLLPRLQDSHDWRRLNDSQPRVARALDRARAYLLLGGSLGIMLAAIAVGLSAHLYSRRQYDYVALMKSMGASSLRIRRLYLSQLLALALATTLIGWLLGWCIHHGFLLIIKPLVGANMPAAGGKAYGLGALTDLVCLVAFALPPLFGLQKVPPLRVLRRDISIQDSRHPLVLLLGASAIAGLMLLYSQNLLLTLGVLAGVLSTALVLGALVLLVLRSSVLVGMQAGSVLGLAIASLRRRALRNAIQVLIFSVAIMLLLMLGLVRNSLLQEWRMQLPEHTPNHFVLNIAAHDLNGIKDWFSAHKLQTAGIYPVVRARLTHVNNVDIEQLVDRNTRFMAGIERELNLTWSAALPEDNRVVSGQWWSDASKHAGEVSLEQHLARRLGIKPGDTLSFSLGASRFEARVSSIRQLQWDRMRPNFYMIFAPGLLEQYAPTYMTSFFLSEDSKPLLNDLLQMYPTITLIEMDAIIEEVKRIIDQVSMAIELLLGLIIVAGALVLFASVLGSLDERLRESALLRSLGARRRIAQGSLVLEFALMGALAGLFAAAGAEVSVYMLQSQVFMMAAGLHPNLWLAGPPLGALLLGVLGFLATRRVVTASPMLVLREI